jgi:hypothetical protein
MGSADLTELSAAARTFSTGPYRTFSLTALGAIPAVTQNRSASSTDIAILTRSRGTITVKLPNW